MRALIKANRNVEVVYPYGMVSKYGKHEIFTEYNFHFPTRTLWNLEHPARGARASISHSQGLIHWTPQGRKSVTFRVAIMRLF
jgi:hypothetical protein